MRALPDAFALRMLADIQAARTAPITVAEMQQLAEDHGLPREEVERLAAENFYSLRATAEAVRRLAQRGNH